MFKKVYFILIFAFFSTNVWANACDDAEFAPKLMFYSSYGKLEYVLDKNMDYISNLATENNYEENFVAGGLALSTLKLSSKIDAKAIYQNPYDVCVVPQVVHVFVGFQDPKIYIASEYEEDSCEFYITLRHEQAHMQINKKALEYFLPEFRKEIEKIVLSVPPLNIGNVADIEQASQYLNQQYYFMTKDLVIKFNEILAEEQNKLDTKSNYAYERSLCK